jgi:cysteine-rich repeat protein
VATARRALGHCGEPLCFRAPDTLLNSTVAGAQELPAVATAPDGTTLLVFRDRSGLASDATHGDAIRARFFDGDGVPQGEDRTVETDTTRTQTTPVVAASTEGVFLVVWADNRLVAPDLSGYGVRARRFLSDGTPLDAADFPVNLATTGDQHQPTVAATPDGGFLVAWRDTSRRAPDAASGSIRARRVGIDGALGATELLLNSTTLGDQSEPALAVAPDGRWAVVFTDASATTGDASGTQVRVRFFGADDAPAGLDQRVNDRTEGDQRQADVSFAADGSALVVFTDLQLAGASTGADVLGRRYDDTGSPLGSAFDVATTNARAQTLPVVGALMAEGRWLVAFTDDSRTAPDISGTGVRGRLLRFDGVFDGADQVLATATFGAQTSAALPARVGAGLLVAWADSGNVAPDVAAPAVRGRWASFARCGDGRIDPETGETCDDANRTSEDGCSEACQLERCGDGVVQASEACDDGEANTRAGPCLPDCTPARCGDGIRQLGEACDDGNRTPGDGCTADCAAEPPTRAACAVHCRPVAAYDGCNGSDDDCDGLVDEDAQKGFDTEHCGGCDQGPCAASTPYAVRLSAPPGAVQWEPSGAAVVGDLLWVANDKDGRLAAYDLPLAAGPNAPVRSFTVRPNGATPKWEALRVEANGRFLLHNATGNTLWRCDPEMDCADLAAVPIAAQLTALGAATRLESLAPVDGRLWLGTRATPSRIADESGVAISLGTLSPDGRTYQMSDALLLDDRFYMLWSFEGAGSTVQDVAGLLAVATLDASGRPDPTTTRICRTLRGKPEGFDVWGEDFVVVFDQDDARKAKGAADPTRFALLATEDFATRVPTGVCD